MRRKAAPKRTILPDPLFESELIAKFINTVMRSGKKSVAEKIVYGALENVLKRMQNTKSDGSEKDSASSDDIRLDLKARGQAIEAFEKAISNVRPMVEVKSRRVGGSTFQVPIEVRADRRLALAMRWLVEYAKGRNEKTMMARLGGEIFDAIHGRGGAVKKREDVHKMAKANQAFAHYRW